MTLRWRHNGRDSVSNHQSHDCLLNRLFRRRSKKTSKLRVTGLCVGNSPGTGEFPAQMASNAENVSIWWRHHAILTFPMMYWEAAVMTDGCFKLPNGPDNDYRWFFLAPRHHRYKTSHEFHGVQNTATNATSKPGSSGPLLDESVGDWWIPFTNRQ